MPRYRAGGRPVQPIRFLPRPSFSRAILLFFSLIFEISAISTAMAQSGSSDTRENAVVTVGKVGAGVLMFHPLYISLGVEREISALIYGDGLLRRNESGATEGALASLPTTADGGRSWTFTLYSGIRFHDQEFLTASDVVFSYQLYKQARAYDPVFHRYFQNLEMVQTPDARTVRFVMKEPVREFPSVLATLPIMPKHQHDRRFFADAQAMMDPNRPIGLGPFRLETWPVYDTVILSANKNWHRGKPSLDGIVYRFYPSFDELQAAFVRREVDLIELDGAGSPVELKLARESSKIHAVQPDRQMFVSLFYNNQHPMLSSKAVRQALTHATDRERIMSQVMMPGTGELAYSPVSSSFWANGNAVRYGYAPDRAQRILRAAGWQDKQKDGILRNGKQILQFELIFPRGSVSAEKVVRLIKLNLSDIGVQVTPVPVEQKELVQRLRLGVYECALYMQDFEPSPDGFYSMFHSESIELGFNMLRYGNRQVDRSIGFLFGIPDRARALPIYRGLQMQISEDQPCTFLYFITTRYVAYDARIQNVSRPGGARLNPPDSWFIREDR
ncbi:MAG: hypothetical protein FJY97_19470 [candidate division Zixibacteria bacterium]|nr:hypothetical protein [candidate division Zixibacteria bacterium]